MLAFEHFSFPTPNFWVVKAAKGSCSCQMEFQVHLVDSFPQWMIEVPWQIHWLRQNCKVHFDVPNTAFGFDVVYKYFIMHKDSKWESPCDAHPSEINYFFGIDWTEKPIFTLASWRKLAKPFLVGHLKPLD